MPVVKVIGAADGGIVTPHDGRYVIDWDANTCFGTLACTSTDDLSLAREFASTDEIFQEWRAISIVEPRRPDGLINRPLTGLTIEITTKQKEKEREEKEKGLRP